jgi:hypothetical protein
MKVLACTFGFTADKVLDALRHLPSERVVLITAKENLEKQSYKNLQGAARILGIELDDFMVDKFDILSAKDAIVELLRDLKAQKHEVSLNVSGGVPLLSNAAIMAAFETGVPAYYIEGEDTVVKLPTVEGMKIVRVIGEEEAMVLMAFEDAMDYRKMRIEGMSSKEIVSAITMLKGKRCIRFEGANGYLTDEGRRMKGTIKKTVSR